MRDFTLQTFRLLIKTLINRGYTFITFSEYLEKQKEVLHSTTTSGPIQINIHNNFYPAICILRHDVDKLPGNSLTIAKIGNELGIHQTFYFRIVPESFDECVIKQILELGHEVGYHYEDVDLVYRKNHELDKEKLIELAYKSFCKNLELFSKRFDVKTIYMHGSPTAKYDNKIIWEKYKYKELGIMGDAYFDINWNEFGYLTDTGRKWDAGHANIRDKVRSSYKFNFKSTYDLIDNIDKLPDKIMISIHPQRWSDKSLTWLNELIGQNMKNIIKKYIYYKLNK